MVVAIKKPKQVQKHIYISPVLNEKINKAIKQKGFASDAEFFRFAAMHYLDNPSKQEESLGDMVKDIKKIVSAKYAGKKIKSLEEQLADV